MGSCSFFLQLLEFCQLLSIVKLFASSKKSLRITSNLALRSVTLFAFIAVCLECFQTCPFLVT